MHELLQTIATLVTKSREPISLANYYCQQHAYASSHYAAQKMSKRLLNADGKNDERKIEKKRESKKKKKKLQRDRV